MSLKPPGLTDRVPGGGAPRRAVGRQNLRWLLDGPHSSPDWNASQRRAAVLALRELAATVLTLWAVMAVRLLTPLPGGLVFWAAFVVILVLALKCLYRFALDRPVELHAVIGKVMALVLAYVVARFGLDPRVAVLIVLPGAVAFAAVIGRAMASALAGWVFCVLATPTHEREVARMSWGAGAETRSAVVGCLILTGAWLAAGMAVLADGPGLFPAVSFVVAAVSGWCLFSSHGHPPHLVARVVWFMVKLWLSYNPPLTNGRTVREPHLYLMDEPWQLQPERAFALQAAVVVMGIATTSLTDWPPPVGSPGAAAVMDGPLGVLVLDTVCQAAVATLLPFGFCLTVWFTIFGTALTGHWCRFAAAAVADAERRSET